MRRGIVGLKKQGLFKAFREAGLSWKILDGNDSLFAVYWKVPGQTGSDPSRFVGILERAPGQDVEETGDGWYFHGVIQGKWGEAEPYLDYRSTVGSIPSKCLREATLKHEKEINRFRASIPAGL